MEQEFLNWYKSNQRSFHCSQFDEEQISYAAWLEGHRQSLTVNDIVELVQAFSDTTITKEMIIEELKLNFHKYKFN